MRPISLAERRGLETTKGVVLEDEITLLRVLIRRFPEQILVSWGETPIETAANLAVISEAMLRLCWNKVEPPKRSGGGCLLRTNHMLGGSESNTFIQHLNLVLADLSEQVALDES